MKKLFLTFFCFLATSLFASDQAQMWAKLYKRALSSEQKEMILQNIVFEHSPESEPMLAEALKEMNASQEQFKGSHLLESQWIRMTRLIVNELGSLKASESADDIYFVLTHTDSPILKADSLVALGNMRAIDYVDEISLMLRNLNFNTQNLNYDNAEIIAYGAIYSLMKMRRLEGFEPVFYASSGWYSKRTKQLASKALAVILEDPTEALIPILQEADYPSKIQAVIVEGDSLAPKEEKNKLAITALEEGLKYSSADKLVQQSLSSLRVESMKLLIENRAKEDLSVPFLLEITKQATDINEVLYAYVALGVNGSDQAVKALSERLSYFNDRQSSGIAVTRNELDMVKQIIKAIGMSGNPIGMVSLQEVPYSNYTPAVNRLAKESMALLK